MQSDDSSVLERAEDDRKATEAVIEQLRAEIADHERHIEHVARFINMFEQYASAVASTGDNPQHADRAE